MPKDDEGSSVQLRAALIAAGAALVGGLIGGGASYLGTEQQIHAQAQQSQSDYLRAERKAAYSSFLRQERDLRASLVGFVVLLRTTRSDQGVESLETGNAQLTAAVPALRAKRSQLGAYRTDIEMVAPDQIAGLANDVTDSYSSVYTLLGKVRTADPADLDRGLGEVRDVLARALEQNRALVQAMRRDFGVDGDSV